MATLGRQTRRRSEAALVREWDATAIVTSYDLPTVADGT